MNKLSQNQHPRIAILGARGIGRVHARIFQKLGADVCAVLASSDETAEVASKDLADSFGIQTKSFSRVKDVLSEPLDAVSICTPPELHFEHTCLAFDRGLPVFCEKPLFWNDGLTVTEIEKKLHTLEIHPKRKLLVNTSNTVFADTIINSFGQQKNAQRFVFQFYTQGSYQGKGIALDLLPHGLSILLHLFGVREINNFTCDINRHNFSCSFNYGEREVVFDFQEKPGGPKALKFSFDDNQFQRIQEGCGATYKVFIESIKTKEKFEVQDPFTVYISRFLQNYVINKLIVKDDYMIASANIELMVRCADAINSSCRGK